MVDVQRLSVDEARQRFAECGRTHVLMITNHGVHEWEVVPGMPDTGGQNVYVNQFTEALIAKGCRVTIINRGGYPHPQTGAMQSGEVYHPSGYARIVYLEDDKPDFVRKEDMNEQIPKLVENLTQRIGRNGDAYDLIISNYWDAGKLGAMVNGSHGPRVPHLWIPHSLGALKKRNMDPSTWADLRIDERICHETELLASIDGGVATSSAIRDTFKNDYGYDAKYFLPPCVDENRYRPRSDQELEAVWSFLAEQTGLSRDKLRRRRFVTEISRTDKTKRKDVLIKAFAQVKKEVPEAFLLVAIDPHAEALHDELLGLIAEHKLKRDVLPLGSIWNILPLLYSVTDVYCTPSVMEGFGMSAQEAAATGKPVVSSNLVPFVVEYLIGSNPEHVHTAQQDSNGELLFGEGGVVVPADFVTGFAQAITTLLKDDQRRLRMGAKAREITVPYFTWAHLTDKLFSDLGVCVEGC